MNSSISINSENSFLYQLKTLL